MDASKNELIIVDAISQMVIPADIYENSEFKQVINDFKSAQENVKKNVDSIELKRDELKKGNYFGNWWHNREAALKDAQLDLNKSIGLLTKLSSDLILFNTAISKVLVSQQKILHEQQNLLKKQATNLASQNESIKKHQVDLSEQQESLLKVNKGLLEAKGITSEHAEKLVGCVKRVEMAEQNMERSNHELERSIVGRIVDCEGRTESFEVKVNEVLCNYRQEAAAGLESLSADHNSAIEGLRNQLSNFELKINAESEVRKQAVSLVTDKLDRRFGELQNEQEVRDKKLLSDLEAAKESFESQIVSLTVGLDKHNAVSAEKNKRLLYFSVTALIVSCQALAASAYVYFVVLHL
ncbi:hypothetical protein [Shewanella subflava]|uniref:Uncharacterized protein n=1 Tax=Shewanella subflava TaxID=2986476 RepID=A0ABT3I5W2_9GAMM|nr:hypothetical protein [Shewanella subflava]MCW3171387.1 hypothetical protein [Shewanella subflava]